jgi:hypothetical protein
MTTEIEATNPVDRKDAPKQSEALFVRATAAQERKLGAWTESLDAAAAIYRAAMLEAHHGFEAVDLAIERFVDVPAAAFADAHTRYQRLKVQESTRLTLYRQCLGDTGLPSRYHYNQLDNELREFAAVVSRAPFAPRTPLARAAEGGPVTDSLQKGVRRLCDWTVMRCNRGIRFAARHLDRQVAFLTEFLSRPELLRELNARDFWEAIDKLTGVVRLESGSFSRNRALAETTPGVLRELGSYLSSSKRFAQNPSREDELSHQAWQRLRVMCRTWLEVLEIIDLQKRPPHSLTATEAERVDLSIARARDLRTTSDASE